MKAALSWLPTSLKARLLVASFVLLPLMVGVAGVALQNSFYKSLELSLEERMRLKAYLVINATAEDENQRLRVVTSSADVEGHLPIYIHDYQRVLQWSSSAAQAYGEQLSLSLSDRPLTVDLVRFEHWVDEGVFVYQYPVQWRGKEPAGRYLFSIVQPDTELKSAMTAYKLQLWGWLVAVILLSLVIQAVITRWALSPLQAMVDDLVNIERGYATRLAGEYPQEVQGVTDSLNHLLHVERKQRERYRNTLGDLAHSLKTPLAVIRGAGNEQLPPEGYRSVVDEQVRRMDQIVQYQLARAVRSQSKSMAQSTTAIAPMIKRITSALEKVYREKGVRLDLDLDESAAYAADERDLMELLGNMLENAFKYGHSHVSVTLATSQDAIQLDIEDDGLGVSPEMRQVILERGARVDTSAAPGQGIGLTVAVDILSSYNGQLEVGESSLGGASFRITFPLG